MMVVLGLAFLATESPRISRGGATHESIWRSLRCRYMCTTFQIINTSGANELVHTPGANVDVGPIVVSVDLAAVIACALAAEQNPGSGSSSDTFGTFGDRM